MQLKANSKRELFNSIEEDSYTVSKSLLNTIEVLCKSSDSPDVYRRYMELIEKLTISLEANTSKSTYEYLNQFIGNRKINDVKDKDIVGLLFVLLSNVHISVLIKYLSETEYYSYGFAIFENIIDKFLADFFVKLSLHSKLNEIQSLFNVVNNKIDLAVENNKNTPIFNSLQSVAKLIKESLQSAENIYIEYDNLCNYLNEEEHQK